MQSFSAGVLSTPKLQSVREPRSENQFWEGNLNDTIVYLFVQRNLPKEANYVKLSQFPALKQFWHDKQLGRLFRNVKTLTVDGCESFTKALSPNLLYSLIKLTTLEVRDCILMEQVFNLEGMSTDEGRVKVLPLLSKLHLIGLPKLSILWNKDPSKILDLRNLTVLKVENCNSLKYAFTQSVSSCLVQLQGVYLRNCRMMEGIIKKQESRKKLMPEIIFPSLKKISIHDCPNVKTLFNTEQRPNNNKVPSNLEELLLDSNSTRIILDCEFSLEFFSKVKSVELISFPRKSCLALVDFLRRLPNLEKLLVKLSSLTKLFFLEGNHSASFENLKTLEVEGWNKLTSLLPLSVAKSMVQLVTLRVQSCDMMVEIVESEQKGTADEIVFSKLENIELRYLDSLRSFCQSHLSFDFPSLKQVTVLRCPNMRIFCHGVLTTPKLDSVKVLSSGVSQQELNRLQSPNYRNLNAMIRESHCFDLVGFHGLKELKLSKFPIVRENWHKLKFIEKLVVDECASFSNAFSLNQLQDWMKLKELVVEKCDLLQQVFDLERTDFDKSKSMRRLEKLQLIDLSNLRHLWSKAILSLNYLEVLKIQNCCNLTYIFTVSMALCLKKLKDLEVKGCSLVKHIITTGDEDKPLEGKTVFPSLQSMTLHCLQSFISFYSTSHVLECSSLKFIDVTDCPERKVIKTDDGKLGMGTLVPSIFGGQLAFPNLEELRVEWSTAKDIWVGRFQIPFLDKLKAIELTCFPGEKAVLPSNFLQALQILEKLVLSDASYEEIIIDEAEAGGQILACLRELKLCKLPNLKHLIEHTLVIERLETLKILKCGGLEVLVSPSVSFQRLTKLQVSQCHRLRNLMTPATARSLALLKRMVIKDCKMIQEIVSTEAGGIEDEIHFGQLEYFELDNLPCLTSFCSVRYTFNFPSLEDMIIRECPQMETFAQGVVTTSKLWKVQTGEYKCEWEWKGSLNNTIRASPEEMVGTSDIGDIGSNGFLQTSIATAESVDEVVDADKVTMNENTDTTNTGKKLKKPLAILQYSDELDTPDKVKFVDSVFSDRCPLTIEPVGDAPNHEWKSDFTSWIEKCEFKRINSSNEMYSKSARSLHPSTRLCYEQNDKKDFYLQLHEPGGYLESAHIDILFGHLRKKCKILNKGFTTCDNYFDQYIQTMHKEFSEEKDINKLPNVDHVCNIIVGSEGSYKISWGVVKNVLFPVHLYVDGKQQDHFVLARLSFDDRKFYIYNSLRNELYNKLAREVVTGYAIVLPFLLDRSGFYDRNDINFKSTAYIGKKNTDPFVVILLDELPTQESSDCGIFITAFAEYLIESRSIPIQSFNVASIRNRYAINLYMYEKWKRNNGYNSNEDV
ncbi:uncharacterized protein LOC126677177 [Mercurialis annua]|uniref:uncharacterized protein LOC126677177 n=1 Tax=Mercurialis annua TaxID=3986 RepID=UPI0021606A4B|nr:uncharacterized protein LOC126677177 [Mercurialis annua]